MGWLCLSIAMAVHRFSKLYRNHLYYKVFNEYLAICLHRCCPFYFFEFTLPFIKQEKKYFLYNILIFLLALWFQLMLCSYGLYAWRYIGIQLHIYTALLTFSSLSHAIAVPSCIWGDIDFLFWNYKAYL